MKIFKYPIEITNMEQLIVLPRGAQIISLLCQRKEIPSVGHDINAVINQMYFHALVDPTARTEHRSLWCVGTGQEIPKGLKHIATTTVSGYVWHLLEKANQKREE